MSNDSFIDLFGLAMDRRIPELLSDVGIALNLGAGNKHIPGATPLDHPTWDADCNNIPYRDHSVYTIHAYHFLEHLKDPVKILLECQRVLVPGGIMNICVPYYSSAMQAHDLDHKHSFTEDTWKILFNNPYYNKNKIEWKFEIGFNLICGVVERNMCLLTQLRKLP